MARSLPRYRRPPIRQIGEGAKRIQAERDREYRAVSLRAKGMCEAPGCDRRQDPLDTHHTFGRGHLPGIPKTLCEKRELLLGLCRRCHDQIHVRGDIRLGDRCRDTACDRFAERHDLERPQLGDPLDDMREMVRMLESRGEAA